MGNNCCFAGVLGSSSGKRSLPDEERPSKSQSQYVDKVNTYEEAFKVQRERTGSWHPSPHWATPAPQRQCSEMSPLPPAFDLEIVDVGSVSGRSPPVSPFASVQLDSDGFKRQTSSYKTAVLHQRAKFEVEQLVASPGNLPKPMLRDQRESIIRQLEPTATYNMLAKLPKKLLDAQTAEAQNLRRKLVRDATIVFVAAGMPGKRFILEQAASLGVKSVVLDHPDSWSQQLVGEGVIAKFLPVDMSQSSEQVFEQALAQIKDLGLDGKTGTVDAITTFVELSVPLVSRLCEALALPGMPPASVDNARDKHQTRACLARSGLPTPRNFLIESARDLAEAGFTVGFPAVLKPVSGAASLGVMKVENAAQMEQSYDEVIKELSSLVVASGALIKGDGSNQGVNASCMINLAVLMEQYLDGPEVDVDVVMSDGEWHYAAVADNGPTLEPYFNETWAASPSLIEKHKQRELKDLAVATVKALGFSAGVFHVECKYTSTGPQLIEVNARMGGGQVRECNLLTWGVDLIEETLFIALGIPARPVVSKAPKQGVAYCYINAKRSGTLGSTQCIQDLASRNGIVWARPLVPAGSKVVGPAEGLPTWLCDLCVTRSTSKEALDYLLKIEQELPVQIQ